MSVPRPVTAGLFAFEDGAPRLIVGRCAACERSHFPAADVCPYCCAGPCRTELTGATARLWLYTSVHTSPPGYRGNVPYGLGIVILSDGLRVVSRLLESAIERLRPEQPMRLVIDTLALDEDGTPVLSYAYAPETTA